MVFVAIRGEMQTKQDRKTGLGYRIASLLLFSLIVEQTGAKMAH